MSDVGLAAFTVNDAEALMARPDVYRTLLAPWVAAIAREPDMSLPFRARRDESGATLTLHRDSQFELSILMLPARLPLPDRVVVSGRATQLRLLAGDATLVRWSAEPIRDNLTAQTALPLGAPIESRLRPGRVTRIDGRQEAWRIRTGDDGAIVLKLVQTVGQSTMSREYRAADGALTNLAALDECGARAAMLLSVLREMDRTDAAPLFAARSEHPAFFLRWRAMREWLALDAQSALPRLTAMARSDPHPEVRAAAAAARAMLEPSCPV